MVFQFATLCLNSESLLSYFRHMGVDTVKTMSEYEDGLSHLLWAISNRLLLLLFLVLIILDTVPLHWQTG
jgi:hypothetical protein